MEMLVYSFSDKFLKCFPQSNYLTSKLCSLLLHFLGLFPHFFVCSLISLACSSDSELVNPLLVVTPVHMSKVYGVTTQV